MQRRFAGRASSLSVLLFAAPACQTDAIGPPEATQATSTTGDTTSQPPDPGPPEPPPTPEPTTTGPAATTSGTLGGTGSSSDPDPDPETTAAPGTCGDGIVDPEETCDLSYLGNHDDGACTQSCQQAYCGDGLVWAGMEACDAGPNNNDTAYNGCKSDCSWGPRCSDGVLQSEEECDASAPTREGAVQCDPDNCRLMARVAFVTAAAHPGALGGLAGADAICIAAATAAGLDNAPAFLAWLSDGVTAPASRFSNGAKNYPYARRDGQKLANDLDDLLTDGLHLPLAVTELGTTLPPEQLAWTAVTNHGLPAPNELHCNEWSSDFAKYVGQVGQISPATNSDADIFFWAVEARWTKFSTRLCNFKIHLYCFED